MALWCILSIIICFASVHRSQELVGSEANNASGRILRSNYGTMNDAFVVLRVNDYLSMNEAIEVAACNSVFNYAHNLRMHQLFGSMNNLLGDHVIHVQCEYCYLTKWRLNNKLTQIPTFKNVKVNLTSIISIKPFSKLTDLFDNSGRDFVRGIDTSSNLPFLLFMITKEDNKYKLVVSVLFDSMDINSVSYRNPRRLHVLHQHNKFFTMDDMVSLLMEGKCYDVFNVPNSMWMVESERMKREKYEQRLQECGECVEGCCECCCGCLGLAMINPIAFILCMALMMGIWQLVKDLKAVF